MSLREIDLQAETYYDCENGVYDLFTQCNIKYEHITVLLEVYVDRFNLIVSPIMQAYPVIYHLVK